MKKKLDKSIESKRITKGVLGSNSSMGNNGAFLFVYKHKEWSVIISDGGLWDHVSISHPNITPSWDVMCYFKDLFFEENETVIQYHPSKASYKNIHPHCLHLWRPQNEVMLMPDLSFV